MSVVDDPSDVGDISRRSRSSVSDDKRSRGEVSRGLFRDRRSGSPEIDTDGLPRFKRDNGILTGAKSRGRKSRPSHDCQREGDSNHFRRKTFGARVIDDNDAEGRDAKRHSRRSGVKPRSEYVRSHSRYCSTLDESESDESDVDDANVVNTSKQKSRVKLRTYDGTTSRETFWAHFQSCANYNG